MNNRGRFRIPVESSDPNDRINFVNFKGQTVTVPGSQRHGKCRPLTDFMKLGKIGEGSSGIVYKVKDKITNQIYALKKRKIENEHEVMPQKFLRETTNLRFLRHENIIKLIDVAVGENFESTSLILEFCKYSLSRLIDDDPKFLTPPLVKNIMLQLFTGLDFIHKRSIFHRDINPANILFDEKGTLKITDFDSSRKITNGNMTPNIGTQWYRAPEILFGSVIYSSSADIWSAGCIFGEMLAHNVLFRGETGFDIVDQIINLLGSPTESEWPDHSKLPFFQDYDVRQQRYSTFRPKFISETSNTVTLIRGMLVYNPAMRLSAEKCLKDQYFRDPPEACPSRFLVSILHTSESI